MSAGPRKSPQIGRIARLLHVDIEAVEGLEGIPDEDLRTLHDQISRTLFADAQDRFLRVAGLSKAIPGPLAGKLAERFLPPVIAARVSEVLDPGRARDLVGRVSVRYLGDIAMVLDPVRSRPVVQALPAARIGNVAKEMFRRREYAVMAEFVSTVTVDALFAALAEATPHDLLAVAPLLEWHDNLDHVIAQLPPAQVADIATALDAVELADLALALDPSRFGPIVAHVDDATVAVIAAELFGRGEHQGMARLAAVMSQAQLEAAFAVASPADLASVEPHLTPPLAAELAARSESLPE